MLLFFDYLHFFDDPDEIRKIGMIVLPLIEIHSNNKKIPKNINHMLFVYILSRFYVLLFILSVFVLQFYWTKWYSKEFVITIKQFWNHHFERNCKIQSCIIHIFWHWNWQTFSSTSHSKKSRNASSNRLFPISIKKHWNWFFHPARIK